MENLHKRADADLLLGWEVTVALCVHEEIWEPWSLFFLY